MLDTKLTPTEAMRVTCPEGESGNVAVRRFTVSEEDARRTRLQAMMHGGRGYVPAGEYTELTRNGGLWMSDTPDERRDHVGFVYTVQRERAKTVLINGLGLGMVAQSIILTCPLVEQITVCDIDPDVIALVGPHLRALAAEHGKYLDIVEGDAYEPAKLYPKGSRWDAAWSDIWQDITLDNWDGYCRIRRAYGSRTRYHGQWAYEMVKHDKRRQQSESWW